MDKQEIIKNFPALGAALDQDSALRPFFDALLSAGLDGVFAKTLAGASPETIALFLREVGDLDFARIAQHRQALQQGEQQSLRPEQVQAVSLVTLGDQAAREQADQECGLDALAQGHWASVAFAGGAGTRFFSQLDQLHQALAQPNEGIRAGQFDIAEPKGVFPISPVGGLSFYQLILAQALATGVATKRLPRVLMLTSELTHERTAQYLARAPLWGYPQDHCLLFTQAREPRLDVEGDLIVADEAGRLNKTGDGHGGVYRALLENRVSGQPLLEFLKAQGVHDLIMHNVDNPAARPFAPARLGFHQREQALFTLSAVRKTDPEEKVGVLMRLSDTGRMEVIEYNVLDPSVAGLTNAENGRLLHEAGNTNTNLVALEAVRADLEPSLYTGKQTESRVGPVAGSSLEMLNQHLTRLLDPERVRAYEVDRAAYFMPTKNVIGNDSVSTTSQMLSDQSRRLLAAAGAEIDPAALCDVHPACGGSSTQLGKQGLGPGWRLAAGARLYLCVGSGDGQGAPVSEGRLSLEPESSLLVYGQQPYGQISVDQDSHLQVQAQTSSCLHIGPGVKIRRGVRVEAHIGPGARLRLPAGREITGDMKIELAPGQDREI